MQKLLISCAMALVMIMGTVSFSSAEETKNSVDMVTGDRWLHSKRDEKLAYILGIESAISVEYAINEKVKERAAAKKAKGKPMLHNISPFERGWATVFKDVKREDIVAGVDSWYKEHPDQRNRSVMSVIWYELIAPKL